MQLLFDGALQKLALQTLLLYVLYLICVRNEKF